MLVSAATDSLSSPSNVELAAKSTCGPAKSIAASLIVLSDPQHLTRASSQTVSSATQQPLSPTEDTICVSGSSPAKLVLLPSSGVPTAVSSKPVKPLEACDSLVSAGRIDMPLRAAPAPRHRPVPEIVCRFGPDADGILTAYDESKLKGETLPAKGYSTLMSVIHNHFIPRPAFPGGTPVPTDCDARGPRRASAVRVLPRTCPVDCAHPLLLPLVREHAKSTRVRRPTYRSRMSTGRCTDPADYSFLSFCSLPHSER